MDLSLPALMQPRMNRQGRTGRAELGQALPGPSIHLQWIWECRLVLRQQRRQPWRGANHTCVEGKGATSPASNGRCEIDPNAPKDMLHPCRRIAPRTRTHPGKPTHGDAHTFPAISDTQAGRTSPVHPGPACTRMSEHSRAPCTNTHPPPRHPTSPAAAFTTPRAARCGARSSGRVRNSSN